MCKDNVLVITTWSPIHLRNDLKKLYWKTDKPAVKAADFGEDTLRYLYLPRMRDRGVLEQAVIKGAASRDFYGTAYGQACETYEGFKYGDANVQLDDTLLLIEPDAAKTYELAHPPKQPGQPPPPGPTPPPVPKSKTFYGSADVAPAAAKMRLVQIAEEIIAVLTADPNAEIKVSVEIKANFPNGAQDQTKRAVSSNTKTLGFKTAEWE